MGSSIYTLRFGSRKPPRRSGRRAERRRGQIESLENRSVLAGNSLTSTIALSPLHLDPVNSPSPPMALVDQYATSPDDSPLHDVASGVYLDDTTAVLSVLGTTRGDTVSVRSDGANTIVHFNGQDHVFVNRATHCTQTVCFSRVAIDRIDVYGFAGHDRLTNDSGLPLLAFGGTGNDTIYGGSGRDQLRGGDGSDYLNGRDDDDHIEGGAGDDSVVGGTGNDRISGQVGNDTFWAESGDDQVWGDAGDDTIDGGAGADRLFGGTGNDKIFGRPDNDYIEGQAGDDFVDGGTGDDILSGQAGVDSIFGDLGNDVLYGDDGNDILAGGAGADTIWGQGGGDRIDGGPGYDYLYGGPDVDRFEDDGIEGSDVFPWLANSSQNLIGDFDYFGFERARNTHFAWADVYVNDDALRSLVRERTYVDFVLDRNDMLAIYRQVRVDDWVSVTEFEDIQAIAGRGPSFQMPDHVRVLAENVAFVRPGNDRWTGGSTTSIALGNFAPNDSGWRLGKLVDKWFRGLDLPTARGVSNLTYTYRTVTGGARLWADAGPMLTDIRQGDVGDCYFLAGLGTIAARDPTTIRNMFIDNGDGTYTVRFFKNGAVTGGVATYVTVNRQLPVDDSNRLIFASTGLSRNDPALRLWVALAEKAYVQAADFGTGWIDAANWVGQRGKNAYLWNDKLANPTVDAGIGGGDASYSIRQVSNRTVTTRGMTSSTDQLIIDALKANKMVALSSNGVVSAGFVANHQYVVRSYDAATRMFTLYNPWGTDVQSSRSDLKSNFNIWYES